MRSSATAGSPRSRRKCTVMKAADHLSTVTHLILRRVAPEVDRMARHVAHPRAPQISATNRTRRRGSWRCCRGWTQLSSLTGVCDGIKDFELVAVVNERRIDPHRLTMRQAGDHGQHSRGPTRAVPAPHSYALSGIERPRPPPSAEVTARPAGTSSGEKVIRGEEAILSYPAVPACIWHEPRTSDTTSHIRSIGDRV